MRLLTFLAGRFVAGDTIEEAKDAVRKLNSNGLFATLDILGENVTNKEEAVKCRDSYIDLLEFIAGEKLNSNVSLKLTMLGLDLGQEFCTENLRAIVKKAKELNNFVRVDMEGSPYTQKTLDVFLDVYRDFKGHVGIVIQAYLFRSLKDIEYLGKIHAPVRLCKGAYKESKEIVYKNMNDIRKNFFELSKNLVLDGGYHAFATHDKTLIAMIKDYTREKGVAKDSFEFQMLYGIRRGLSKKLADEGYKVRIYVPYGTHWIPYTIRRLRERKENIIFVIKNLFTD